MVLRYYLAIADRVPGDRKWSILFPAYPSVTSVAEDVAHLMRQARYALATAVEDMALEGEKLPPSLQPSDSLDYDRSQFGDPTALLVPVEVSG